MDSAILTVLVNAGVAGVVVVLIMTGWLVPRYVYRKKEKEVDFLREAYELQRQRNEVMASQMGVANQLIGAIVELADKREPDRGTRTLTWKDIS